MNQNLLDMNHEDMEPAPATAQVIQMPRPNGDNADRQTASNVAMSESPEKQVAEKQSRLKQRLDAYVAQVNAFVVASPQDLQTAEAIAKELQAFRKDVGFLLDPIIADAHRAHKTACAKKNELDKPAESAFNSIKAKMRAWIIQQDRAREEELARANAEAQRQNAALLAAQQAALRAAPPPPMAGASLPPPQPVQPPMPPPSFVPPPVQLRQDVTLNGSQLKRPWTYEVTNMMDLVRAVAAGRVPLEVLQVNDKFLKARVEANRNSLRYPGVRVFQEAQLSIR